MNAPIVGQKKGYFITFEGSDGAGKSTQIDLLRQALQKSGFKVRMIREPGSTVIGEKLREIIKDPKNKEMCPETELLLLNAARAQLVREVIRPSLAAGEIVICDRYYHSTIVYQGFGRQLDTTIVKAIVQFAIEDVVPDVTYVLFLTKEEAEHRLNKRGKDCRFEKEDEGFSERVQKGIDWLRKQELSTSGKIVSIDANNSVENIHNEIYRCTASRISNLPIGQLEIEQGKKVILTNA